MEHVASREQIDSRSDDELIASLNAGDVSAFDPLYFRYRDWVVNLAFRFTRDHEISLDVLQETFLYPAVRNLSIAARQKNQRFQSSEDELQKIDNTPALEISVGERSAFRGRRQVIRKHREVLLLRFVDSPTGFKRTSTGAHGFRIGLFREHVWQTHCTGQDRN